MRRPRPIFKTKTTLRGVPCIKVTTRLPGGKRTRRFFKSEKEADAFIDQQTVEVLNHGAEGASLPSRVRLEAIEAVRLLTPYNISLLDAARFYIAQSVKPAPESVTFAFAAEEILKAKKADGYRASSLTDLRCRLARLTQTFGDRLLTSISTPEIDDWLRSLNVRPRSRNSFRVKGQTLFNFARDRGWAVSNPFEKAVKLKVADAEPGILSPSETGRLLGAASSKALPYLAIGAFAGLRSAELCRLSWEDIDFDARLIEVPAIKSKVGRARRLIAIQPNLALWLEPYRGWKGSIIPGRARPRGDMGWIMRDELVIARAKAGLTHWPSNALRHSFASYHLARFQNAPQLSLELGHHNPDILFHHYRNVVTPKAAEQYWGIVPTADRVIELVA